MKEWFIDKINLYMPLIEPYLEDETIVHRFVGLFDGIGARGSGLFVITEKNIYFRGKPKAGATTFTWQLVKAKEVQHIPIDSIYEFIQKKNKFILKLTLDWMGEKYVGKKDKTVFEMYQGKEGKVKESKEELMKRVMEFKTYIESKMGSKDKKFCPHCGIKLSSETGSFCPNCGKPTG